MVTMEPKIAFSAVTTASDRAVHWVELAGVPPLKWYRFDHRLVPPLNGMVLMTLMLGVAAMRGTVAPESDDRCPVVCHTAQRSGGKTVGASAPRAKSPPQTLQSLLGAPR